MRLVHCLSLLMPPVGSVLVRVPSPCRDTRFGAVYGARVRSILLSSVLVLCACGTPAGVDDAGTPMPEEDSGLADSGVSVDAGAPSDAGVPVDAGLDAGVMDAGVPDSGVVDAGVADAGVVDAGAVDAGVPDAGALDAASVDAGAVDAGVDAGLACGRCATGYTSVMNAGALTNSAIDEISGIAASRVHANVLYAHNDSGGAAVVYVLSPTGASLGELQLMGATNFDWEDIAVGPCPSGTCVYVADIGDNGSNRATPYYLYRFPEPAMVPMGSVAVTSWERLEIAYPNGAHFDCETFMVHPVSGDVYLVTKHQFGTKSSAYKALAPLSTSTPNTLSLVANLAVPDGLDLPITGGDIDPCGQSVLLRSYNALYQFTSSGGAFDSVFTSSFTRVPSPPQSLNAGGEIQGEAVSWLPGGGYVTVSEGVAATVHVVSCQ